MERRGLFQDTIFALSSGRLPAGVAIIRLSGPHVTSIVAALAGTVPEPRRLRYCRLRSRSGEMLDHGLAVFFAAPESFTGEDCAELHVHGGVATVAAVLSALGEFEGLRQAEAGEFTRRAFLNGKMDLTEVEGLSDLIAAETEAQRRLALANAEGGQSLLYNDWRRRILHARAMIEAEIDFADEGDVPGSVSDSVWADMSRLSDEIGDHLSRAKGGEIVRSGLDVVILGAPNAGKSSLMNALAGRDVSIITEEAGTTRDLVEVRLDIGGFRVNITDTAGIREDAGRVEAIGIERARAKAANCDLVLLVEDMCEPVSVEPPDTNSVVLRLGLKADLADRRKVLGYDLGISVKSGEGLDDLRVWLAEFVRDRAGKVGEPLAVRDRQLGELTDCLIHVREAVAASGYALELRAEDLRLAGEALARVTGRIDVEDLLDVIFSQFCVGK